MKKILLSCLTTLSIFFSIAQVSPVWVKTINPFPALANFDGYIADVTLDDSGFIYTVGGGIVGNNVDYITTKYNSNGDTVWKAVYNHTINGSDIPCKIVLDDSNNVIVSGQSQMVTNLSSTAIATVKYDNNGNLKWVQRSSLAAYFKSMKTDSLGNIYITGRTQDSPWKSIIIKYDANGTQLWAKTYSQTLSAGFDLIIDENLNVYVAGDRMGSGTNHDGLLLKYDLNGNLIWSKFFIGPTVGDDYYFNLFENTNGNIVALGTVGYDSIIINIYDTAGNVISGPIYHQLPGFSPLPSFNDLGNLDFEIYLDLQENIYLGSIIGNNNKISSYIVKFNSQGVFQWETIFNSTSLSDDRLTSFVKDSLDNLFISGYTIPPGAFEDSTNTFLAKYDSNGNFKWKHIYNGPANKEDKSYSIAVGNQSVYLSGYTENSSGYYLFLLMKYNLITGFEDDFLRSQLKVYPNPATEELFIKLPDVKSEMKLTLINTLGQLIKENSISNQGTFKLDVTSVPSGIYFLKLFNEENQFTQKVIITK